MRVKSIDTEVVKGLICGEEFDFERYYIETKTAMSTQEYTLTVNHIDKKMTGDCVRFGEWGTVSPEQVRELLTIVEEAGELLSPCKDYEVV